MFDQDRISLVVREFSLSKEEDTALVRLLGMIDAESDHKPGIRRESVVNALSRVLEYEIQAQTKH